MSGPEIHEDKKGFLFRRGLKVEPGEGNTGMCLSEVVLEFHGWPIALVDDGSDGAWDFNRMPTESS